MSNHHTNMGPRTAVQFRNVQRRMDNFIGRQRPSRQRPISPIIRRSSSRSRYMTTDPTTLDIGDIFMIEEETFTIPVRTRRSSRRLPSGVMMGPVPIGIMMGPGPGGIMMGPGPGGIMMGPGPGGIMIGPGHGGIMMRSGPRGIMMGPGPGGPVCLACQKVRKNPVPKNISTGINELSLSSFFNSM